MHWETKTICATDFIVIHTLLWWFGTKSTISLRYACTPAMQRCSRFSQSILFFVCAVSFTQNALLPFFIRQTPIDLLWAHLNVPSPKTSLLFPPVNWSALLWSHNDLYLHVLQRTLHCIVIICLTAFHLLFL